MQINCNHKKKKNCGSGAVKFHGKKATAHTKFQAFCSVLVWRGENQNGMNEGGVAK